jgi:hypothetical protein
MVEGLGHEHNGGQSAVSFSHGNQWRIDWVINIIMVKAAVLSAMETISAVLAAREGQNSFALEVETVTDEWRPVSWCSWWVYFSML